MGRVSNFLRELRKVKKKKEEVNYSKVNYRKKVDSKLIFDKEGYKKRRDRREFEVLYNKAKKGYNEEVPSSKKVFNVVYFVASKDPEFVKELLRKKKIRG